MKKIIWVFIFSSNRYVYQDKYLYCLGRIYVIYLEFLFVVYEQLSSEKVGYEIIE